MSKGIAASSSGDKGGAAGGAGDKSGAMGGDAGGAGDKSGAMGGDAGGAGDKSGSMGGAAGGAGDKSGSMGGDAGGAASAVRVLNGVPSKDPENDWTLDKAIAEGLVSKEFREAVDLREDWWTIADQGETGSCVGWSSTDSLFWWHLVKQDLVRKDRRLSAWLTWMAAKETDEDGTTAFKDNRGVCLKAALDVLRKLGAVYDDQFPVKSYQSEDTFSTQVYADLAAELKIKGYYRVINDDNCDVDFLRMWISSQGPVIALVDTDPQWLRTSEHRFEVYDKEKVSGAHAVTIVGYDKDYFIIRNSWGTKFCDNGYVYCSNEYVAQAICEAYGIVV